MIDKLSAMPDFKCEKSRLERFFLDRGLRVYFLPKFHCKLNPIERAWCKAKLHARQHCDYTFDGLKHIVPIALNEVTTSDIRKYFRKVRDYMEAYRSNISGPGVEEEVKKYKSHRQYPAKKFSQYIIHLVHVHMS
jgi:transposase